MKTGTLFQRWEAAPGTLPGHSLHRLAGQTHSASTGSSAATSTLAKLTSTHTAQKTECLDRNPLSPFYTRCRNAGGAFPAYFWKALSTSLTTLSASSSGKGTDLPQVSRYLPTAFRDSEAKARDPRHVLRHETHPAVSAANSVPFRMDTGVRDARLQAGQNEQKHTILSDTCMDTQEALDVTYINKKPFLAERLSTLLD